MVVLGADEVVKNHDFSGIHIRNVGIVVIPVIRLLSIDRYRNNRKATCFDNLGIVLTDENGVLLDERVTVMLILISQDVSRLQGISNYCIVPEARSTMKRRTVEPNIGVRIGDDKPPFSAVSITV